MPEVRKQNAKRSGREGRVKSRVPEFLQKFAECTDMVTRCNGGQVSAEAASHSEQG
jgi:hypothetical protein